MKLIQYTGLALFLAALGLFIGLLFMSRYQIDSENLDDLQAQVKDQHQVYVASELEKLKGQELVGKFAFLSQVKAALAASNEAIVKDNGISADVLAQYLADSRDEEGGQIRFTEASRERASGLLPEALRQTVKDYTGWLIGREFETIEAFEEQVGQGVTGAVDGFLSQKKINTEDEKNYLYAIMKTMAKGLYWDNPYVYFLLVIGVGTLGALMYIFPAFFDGMPGIKHNHIYHASATSQGLIGILIGVFLIGFYLLLYFRHYWIVEWITLTDPVAMTLRGEPASQWFMYGFLYTLAITVMGIRMFAKYRHSNYHKIRTASVMFFQLAFAFLIPQLLYQLNLPDDDLKNAWPLNYYFLFDWSIQKHIDSGTFGVFMLVWGLVLSFILVPLFSYIWGKRWYCSWVCGCGGLAETLGDPFRQLSDKSTQAWQIERVVIHSVLAFAVLMTVAVLYTYLGPGTFNIGLNRWLFVALLLAAAIGIILYHRKKYPHMGSQKVIAWVAIIFGSMIGGLIWGYTEYGSSLVNFSSYDIRGTYGLAIGSIFAGVVGTGFYPLMGNRVWCRFGCPLAAILGLQQRFASRFRITTNGGQCISCGNCSTYCEMGIDVRAYAQRGQNIVRSSCVGCGVCAAVCPRGVLSLENGPDTGKSRMDKVLY
ncbi:MAG: 4Fe-4S dicluster domain-containing protein [Bacteroidota bacterium]